MDLLAKAIMRSHYARQIPISPKIKPPRVWSHRLPGVAPWREEITGRPVIAPVPRVMSVKEIIAAVAAEFGLTSEQIRGSYRTVKIAFARHVAQYLAQRVTQQSLPIIGRIFCRDHTSVLHGVSKIGRLVETDNVVRELVERLERELRSAQP